jgi:hypothetical protein
MPRQPALESMGRKSNNAIVTKSELKTTKLGLGCLLAFALPFALAGILCGVGVAFDLWTWQAAQRWVETPAQVLESNLKTHDGDDSDTYSVVARYRYEFQGQPYEGDRVTLHEESDSGDYNRDRATALEGIRKAGGQTVCYVNPRNPARAMLYRDLRPGLVAVKLLAALLFGGVGFGLMYAGLYGAKSAKRKEVAEQQHPGKPWMWRPDWAAGRIRSSEGLAAWFITFFALVWNALCWPIALNVLSKGQQAGEPSRWLVALFPLLGIAVALVAIYLWLRRLRWGVSEFEMAAVPGVLGGPLAGVIRAPRGINAEHGFVLKLTCLRTVKRGDSSETDTVWDAEQRLDRNRLLSEGGRTLIPVKFLVPYDEPPSGDDVNWQLSASAEAIGVDYCAQFDVPVFRTKASSRELPDAELLESVTSEDDSIAATVARMNAVLEADMASSRTIRFPPARNRSMAAFIGLFAIFWGGICYGLFLSDAPRLLPWVFSGFWLFILAMAIATCFSSTWLEYGPRGVAYRRKLFGIGRQHDVPRDRIGSIAVEKSGTKYGGTEYRQIVMGGPDGRRVLVSEIARMPDAERLAADIRALLELDGNQRSSTLEGDLPSDFLKG